MRYLFYRLVFLVTSVPALRILLIPNVHFCGFLFFLLSFFSIVHSEHVLAVGFFAFGSAMSLLSFEYCFPVLFLVYFAVNLPKKSVDLTIFK